MSNPVVFREFTVQDTDIGCSDENVSLLDLLNIVPDWTNEEIEIVVNLTCNQTATFENISITRVK